MYRLVHPITTEYTFFSRLHGTFTKTDSILCHKIRLTTFKRIKITRLLSDHNVIKLETNNSKRAGKPKVFGDEAVHFLIIHGIKEKTLMRNFLIF